MPKLVFRDLPTGSFEAVLRYDVQVVGRGRDNDIMVIDPSVSRHHARIERRGKRYFVVDMASKNGVFLNGDRVKESILQGGDRVEFGNVLGEFSVSDDTTVCGTSDPLPRIRALFRDAYDIVEKKGSGSQAEVYRATRLSDGLDVALKVLHGTVEAGSESEARFLREAQTLKRLRHPAILNILEAGRREQIPYFAIDYLPSGSLEERFKPGSRMTVPEAAAIGVRMAMALSHAHEHGIIHRDIKPSNIMFDAKGLAILTDFGIAKVLEDSALTASGAVFGTPRYMSPEQFAGRPATPQSDIYSLGATLYRCLSGRLPIEGDSVAELVERVTNPKVLAPSLQKLVPSVPAAFAAVIHRCIQKADRQRPASAEEVRKGIEQFLPAAR